MSADATGEWTQPSLQSPAASSWLKCSGWCVGLETALAMALEMVQLAQKTLVLVRALVRIRREARCLGWKTDCRSLRSVLGDVLKQGYQRWYYASYAIEGYTYAAPRMRDRMRSSRARDHRSDTFFLGKGK